MTVRVINDEASIFRLPQLLDAMERQAQTTYALAQNAIQARQGHVAMTLVQEFTQQRRVAERTRALIAERTGGEGQA